MIDASIPLGIRPVQITQNDPFEQYGKILGIRNAQAQGDLQGIQLEQAKQSMQADKQLRDLLSTNPNATPQDLMRVNPKFGMDYAKSRAEIMQKEAATLKDKTDSVAKHFELYRQQLGSVSSPEEAAILTASAYQDPIVGDVLRRTGPLPDLVQRIPTDPNGFTSWKQQQSVALDKLMAHAQQQAQLAETQRHQRATEGQTQANAPFVMGPDGKPMPNAQVQAYESSKIAAQRNPTQGKHYDAERGVIADMATGEARPVMQGGAPVGQKPSEKMKSEQLSINQQKSVISGALDAVRTTPTAFTFKRGLATMAGAIPESIAGRMDSADEQTARSLVFNNVSKVINERAGAAQSKQELARLRGFLPAETDSPEQVINKLEGFLTYLSDLEKGNTTAPTNKYMSSADIDLTARNSGKSRAEVIKAAKAAGYTVQ